MFESLILVGPSPCYIDADGYYGGFTEPQIDQLLRTLADNHMGWSAAMSPAIMGNLSGQSLATKWSTAFAERTWRLRANSLRTTFTSDKSLRPGEGGRSDTDPAVARATISSRLRRSARMCIRISREAS